MEINPQVYKRSIEALLKLQEIDAELFRLNSEEKSPPPEVLQVQTQIADLKKELQSLDRVYKDVERERRGFELKLLTLQEDVKRAEGKRRDVRNTKEEFSANKEFENFQKRVADTKKYLDEKTTAAAQKLAARDQKQAEVSALETKLKELQDLRSLRLGDVGVTREKLVSQRDVHIGNVDETVFSLYERVQKIRKGSGIALVKNLVCGGCFVAIPPHLGSRMNQMSEIITCPSCSRIIFPFDEIATTADETMKKVS